MRSRHVLMTTVLAVALLLGSSSARAQDAQSCQPGLVAAYTGPHGPQYQAIINAMVPAFAQMAAQLSVVTDQASYQNLLDSTNALAATLPTGRVVITLPDGTVMIDTSRADGDTPANANSYAHFLAKTINENHNSRLAILAAQEYPCAVGLESKRSTSTGASEDYVAIRAGAHLDSDGTIRMSTTQ
jgi:hypothetical protein